MLQKVALAIPLVLIALTMSVKAETGPFTYYPPGHFIKGSAAFGSSTGLLDYEDNAPNMLFPLKAPAFANSQVFSPGGAHYAGTDGTKGWGDPRNYQYPWQDNFCEERSDRFHLAHLCPSGWAHQGQDIRPKDRQKEVYEVLAVDDLFVMWNNPGDLALRTADSEMVFNYLHISRPTQVVGGVKQEIKFKIGQKVTKGQVVGFVSQVSREPTSVHLHFGFLKKKRDKDGRFIDDNAGYTYVHPYWSLVLAYQRLLGSDGTVIKAPKICEPNTTRCAPPYTGVYTKAALITCSPDGTYETLSWCSGAKCGSPTTCSGTTPILDMSYTGPACAGVPMPRISWVARAPLAGLKDIVNASVATTSDALHVFGVKVVGDHYAYYPALGIWIPKSSPTWSSTWNIPVATSSSGLYAFIPYPRYYVERYDAIGDIWITISGCTGLKPGPVNMTADPKPGGLEFLMLQKNILYSFDPYHDLCYELFTAPVSIGDTAAFITGGVYIFGNGSGLSSVAYRYDVARKVWNTISGLPTANRSGSALVLGGLIGLFGGLSDTISFYDYLSDTWCTGPTKLPVFTRTPFIQSIGGYLYLLDDQGRLWEGTPSYN